MSSVAIAPPPGEPAIGAARSQAFIACRYALILMIPAVMMVYMKDHMMEEGYWTAARNLGRDEPKSQPPRFSWSEKLTFYRADLLVGFLLIPLAAWGLAWFLPRRARALVLVPVSIALVLLLAMEYRAFRLLGRFPSKEIIADGIRFWQYSTDTAGDYLKWSQSFTVKMLALLAAIVLLGWWAARWDRKQMPLGRRCRIAWITFLGGLLVVTGWSWLPWLKAGVFHRSILARIVDTFDGSDGVVQSVKYLELPPAELMKRYRDLTGAPPPRTERAFWGNARDYDVIFFILETAPAKCLAIEGDLKGCPTLRRLRQQSWVARQHRSTYPYTSRAVFSMLTSWYPSSFSENYPQRLKRDFPGVLQCLRRQGYATASYATDTFTRLTDDPMYSQVGVEKRFYSDLFASSIDNSDPVRTKMEYDRIALQALKQDIAGWHKANRRYAVIFQPQIAHGPWADITGGGIPASHILARGRALIGLEDLWLAELVQQLEKAGRLDRTLIVVAGDHGIRTKVEDPEFAVGMIQDYSFHVPLLLYAPGVLSARQDIAWFTSHIDVTPSLLDLLGIAEGREYEQGSPLWDERLAGRTLYFWANHYFGSDGYFQPRYSFAMWNHFTDTVYVNDRLDFHNCPGHTPGARAYAEVTDRLADLVNLQEAWGRLP